MWKKSKLVLLSSVLAFSLTYSATNFVALAAEDTTTAVTANNYQYVSNSQNYVKVKFENTVLYHELVPSKTIIQVLNTNDEVIESMVLSGDKEIELNAPKIEKGQMLSYWSIEIKSNKMIIKPILINQKDVSARFFTMEGGDILHNNALITELVKSVNKGTYLKDILPEVNPKNHYKFTGWFATGDSEEREKMSEKDIADMKLNGATANYYATFYPDANNNNIDDRTEEITVKFVTNSDKKIENVVAHVGEPIELPEIEKKGSIFMGWYTDEKYKNQFENDIFTESLTLYAKWENAEKVIKESQTKPVTDKEISDRIEKILNERLKGLNTNTSTPKNDYNAIQTPSVQIPSVDKGNDSGSANQVNSFKETIYVYDNKNLGQSYMVKFFDENEKFLFSLTSPYGKTIKTYDENEQLRSEYAVRQDTTITLDLKKYINEGSLLLGFDSREVKVNSSQITEVFPETKSEINESAAYVQKQAMDAIAERELAIKKRNNIAGWLIAVAILSIGGAILYLFLKRRKHKQSLTEI